MIVFSDLDQMPAILAQPVGEALVDHAVHRWCRKERFDSRVGEVVDRRGGVVGVQGGENLQAWLTMTSMSGYLR